MLIALAALTGCQEAPEIASEGLLPSPYDLDADDKALFLDDMGMKQLPKKSGEFLFQRCHARCITARRRSVCE